MRNVKETYKSLLQLSEKTDVEGERAAALEAIRRLKQSYGESLDDIDVEQEIKLSYQNKWEKELILYIAGYLSLDAYNVVSIATNRKFKHLIIKGNEHFISLAKELYIIHRKSLKEKIMLFVMGYCTSSLPYDAKGEEGKELSEKDMDVLFAGYYSGIVVNKLRLTDSQ